MNGMPSRSPTNNRFVLIAFVLLVILFITSRHHASISNRWLGSSQPQCTPSDPARPCRHIPGADDILVVIRTGATEIDSKLPVHLATTLQCVPNFTLFTDYQESFCGHEVHDAFEHASEDIKANETQFEFYRQLQTQGKNATVYNQIAIASQDNKDDAKAVGKPKNPSWVLDKWKFLTMANETLTRQPGFQWYVFVELDTVLFWQNLVTWLGTLNATAPLYLGSQMQIGPDIFAYGGSGIIMSAPALKVLVSSYAADRDHWNHVTKYHWAGDCVLGMVLKANGVSLKYTAAMQVTGHPNVQNYAQDHSDAPLLCSPVAFYHHLNKSEIARLWLWEQDNQNKTIRNLDIFDFMVKDQLQDYKTDWISNEHSIQETIVESASSCRDACRAHNDCKQWYHNAATMICSLSDQLRLGRQASVQTGEHTSGWLQDRIDAYLADEHLCDHQRDWR